MAQSKTKTRLVIRGSIKALGFAGAITTALVAPNSTVLLDQYMKLKDKKSAKRTLSYLKYNNLVEVKFKKGQYHYRLTRKGIDRFEKIVYEELSVSTPSRWDKKWRLVMFDIPISKRASHDQLIAKLRQLNFYMLQQSAWIHPFDCEKQIGAILKYLGLEKYVSFLVVEKGNFVDHATKIFKRKDLLM